MKVELADLLRAALEEPAPVPQLPPPTAMPLGPVSPTDSEPSTLLKKDLRLRPDQIAALEHLRIRLMAERTGSALITRNTILRAVVDVIIEHTDDIHGATEIEIRDSIRRAARATS